MIEIKRLLTVLIFSLLLCHCTLLFAQEIPVKPPSTLVYYNSWPGEHDNLLFKNLKMAPALPMNLYLLKDTNSNMIKQIQPGEILVLITADYHTYPANSPVTVLQDTNGLKAGETIYLMGYIGGQTCLAWYKNTVFNIPASGIQGTYYVQNGNIPIWAKLEGPLPQPPELWIYVKTPDNLFGWIKYNSLQDWHLFGQSIFIY